MTDTTRQAPYRLPHQPTSLVRCSICEVGDVTPPLLVVLLRLLRFKKLHTLSDIIDYLGPLDLPAYSCCGDCKGVIEGFGEGELSVFKSILVMKKHGYTAQWQGSVEETEEAHWKAYDQAEESRAWRGAGLREVGWTSR